jgi:hypothetical protein
VLIMRAGRLAAQGTVEEIARGLDMEGASLESLFARLTGGGSGGDA